MNIVEKTIPLETLGLHSGDKLVGFRVSDGNMILRVAAGTADAASTPAASKTKLGDWARKWAGSMELAPGETRESLKSDLMRSKFGF